MKKFRNLDYAEKALKKLNLNYQLPPDLMDQMEIHQYQKGELICHTGIEMEYFYFLSKGRFKVYTVKENGKSLLLRFYEPGSVIGDMEYFNEKKADCDVQATLDVELLAIPFEALEKHTRENTDFMIFICQSLAQKLKNASTSSSINLTYPLQNRFASYLIATSDEGQIESLKAEKFSDLADMLGTTYRHLHRVMKDFVDRGLIEKKGKIIILKDTDTLKDIAGDIYK